MSINNPNELRQSFLDHMKSRGAKLTPSANMSPENDSTTLFTGSGMQPMIPYLIAGSHPLGGDVANTQKCIRTIDIEEVGDNSHLTFFEMIGRWRFGADVNTYKKEQIVSMWEWQINTLSLNPEHLYVSVYQGNADLGIAIDQEAIDAWSELFSSVGIDPVVEAEPDKYGSSRGGRIFLYDEKENWWSRAGVPENMPVGEIGGSDSEMFFDFDPNGDPMDHPATETPRFLEIGNNVFMSYRKSETGFTALDKPNIDYGGGLERVAAALNENADVYLTPFFNSARDKLAELSNSTYEDNTREFRIILDHIRSATFLVGEGVLPNNVDAGYITRRLIRRAVRVAKKLDLNSGFIGDIASVFIDEAAAYPEVFDNKEKIIAALKSEEDKFRKTLESGEKEIKRFIAQNGKVTGADAFFFYETYGFPLELTKEVLSEEGEEFLDQDGFDKASKEHSDKSRTAAAGKFKGGLADNSDVTTAYHSTTHLLLAGLRKILGDHVHQKGSNITPERIRFDFSHGEKMTPEEKVQVEEYVNEAIESDVVVTSCEMDKSAAMEKGVEGSFWEKYPEIVTVYQFKDSSGQIWSEELCGGPHVESSLDVKKLGRFKIKKEGSSSAGVRRIKASLI